MTADGGIRATVGDLWWCVTAGVLTFLSFPIRPVAESSLWPLAWICLIPLLHALRGASPRRAFVYGWVMGAVTNFGGFWWIFNVLSDFGHLPETVAWGVTGLDAIYQGAQFGIFSALVARVGHTDPQGRVRIWTLATLFVAVEHVFPMIFPWYLGNSQYRFLPAVQVAELLGVAGVTFTLVLANGLGLELLWNRGWGRASRAGAAWVALVLVYGLIRIPMVDADIASAPSLRVGIVEANIGIFEKEARGLDPQQRMVTLHGSLLKHQRMSAALESEDVDLIIWPESSYIPLGRIHAKRSDHFAFGAPRQGPLRLWRDSPGGRHWTMGPALPEGARIRAVDACREDAAVLVGDDGLVLYWDGRSLEPMGIQGPHPRVDLYAAAVVGKGRPGLDRDGSPTSVWAVGDDGILLHSKDGVLRELPSPAGRTLRGLAMITENWGVAVGDEGTVVEITDRGGRGSPSGTEADLFAAWGDRETGMVWAAGEGGTILRGDGRRWEAEPSGTQATLRDLAGDQAGALWAVGDRGTVLRRSPDGAWATERIPTRADLVAVAVSPMGEVLIAGGDGSLWIRHVEGPRASLGFEPLDAPGIGPLVDIHPLPWVTTRPIPRDARYIRQSDVPLPQEAVFLEAPEAELAHRARDRASVQRGYRKPVLFGALTWRPPVVEGGDGQRLNTAVLLDGEGRVVGMYDKVYLLVFGEYIPLGQIFPWLYDLVPAAGNFTAGTGVRVFDWAGARIGVLICYEDILPAFAGEVAARKPDLLINVTNDAWFGRTGEPYLHMALAVMRSVESRKTLIRSTNTGVSVVVDPAGRITHRTDLDTAETVVADVALMQDVTLYARIGDLFAYALLLLSVLLWALTLHRRS